MYIVIKRFRDKHTNKIYEASTIEKIIEYTPSSESRANELIQGGFIKKQEEVEQTSLLSGSLKDIKKALTEETSQKEIAEYLEAEKNAEKPRQSVMEYIESLLTKELKNER